MSTLRNSTIRAFALGIITGATLTAGTIALATPAHADNPYGVSDRVYRYAISAEYAVCTTLSEYPTFGGVTGVGLAIVNDSGFTYGEAGEVLAIAVLDGCPEYGPLLQRWADSINSSSSIGGKVA